MKVSVTTSESQFPADNDKVIRDTKNRDDFNPLNTITKTFKMLGSSHEVTLTTICKETGQIVTYTNSELSINTFD